MKIVRIGRFTFQEGTRSELVGSDLILYEGEIALEADTQLMKMGDGKTIYKELPYMNRGPQGQKGDKGEKGDTGTSLTISGTVENESLLPKNPKDGEGYMVQGDLYIAKNGSFINVGRIKGPKGDTGPQGEQGPRGPQGIKGERGEIGPQGFKGDQGDRGPQGIKGDRGDVGPIGKTGPQGEQGPRGIQGATGPQGPVGQTGPTGAKGDKGDPLTFDKLTDDQKKDIANKVAIDEITVGYVKTTDLNKQLIKLVSKETGKGLSSNDYTDEAKKKVDAIPTSPKYTDTVTTINGKTGEITKSDIESLGVGGLTENEVSILALKLNHTDYLFNGKKDLYKILNTVFGSNFSSSIQTGNDILNSTVALQELAKNEKIIKLVINEESFLRKLINSSFAMQNISESTDIMQIICDSKQHMKICVQSNVFLDTLYSKRKRLASGKEITGKFIILDISSDNAWRGTSFGYAILKDFGNASWREHRNKYSYVKAYPSYATYIKNDSDSDDWIDYYDIDNPN